MLCNTNVDVTIYTAVRETCSSLPPFHAKRNQIHHAGIKNHTPLTLCPVFSLQWFNRHIRRSVSAIATGQNPHSESQAFNGTTANVY